MSVAKALRAVADSARFPADDVEDLVAAIVLFAPQTGDEPDDATLELLGRLGGRAGVTDDDDGARTAAKVAAYLQAHPPSSPLVDAVVQALTALVEEGAIDRGSAFGRFVGDVAQRRPVGGPAEDGAVRGGLAALLLQRGGR